MPIQVDHERQRDHVTSLAARLIAQEGVAALTFRRVADAAGSSTAIVSTYFTDKRDLLLSTFRAAASRTTVRFEAAIDAGGSLQDCLEAWLPLDDDRLVDWRVIIAFWGVAVADPELARVQDGHVSRARARVGKLLRQERRPEWRPATGSSHAGAADSRVDARDRASGGLRTRHHRTTTAAGASHRRAGPASALTTMLTGSRDRRRDGSHLVL